MVIDRTGQMGDEDEDRFVQFDRLGMDCGQLLIDRGLVHDPEMAAMFGGT
jgi:hypothetical protein